MPRYKLRVPDTGDFLYSDDGPSVVAPTIREARDAFEHDTGERPVYLHSYIGSCRIAYATDINNGDCHEDAEPGDTTIDYLADDGRELADGEVRCWMLGAPRMFVAVSPNEPIGDARDCPVGCLVQHPVLGWGNTVAPALRHRQGWRFSVAFRGEFDGPHQTPRWIGRSGLAFYRTGNWPALTYRVQVDGETVADEVSDREIADTLGRVRADRLRAEWEREQFDLYLAEHEKTAHA